jgi:exodeoxyribonuclease V alpha subunit
MFAKLLDAMKPDSRIILLGDKDQLASVEAGSLLGDLCLSVQTINQFSKERADWINNFINDTSRKITPSFIGTNSNLLANNIVELGYSHRFNIQGGIGKLSNAVLNNKEEIIKGFIHHNEDSTIKIETTENADTLNKFCRGYEEFIQEQDTKEAIKKLNKLRVLVAVREGERGLYAINRKIELQLSAAGKLNMDKEFYENRPIIVTRNMHQLGLLNGDVGIIRGGRVWFEVPGENTLRSFLPAYITEYETVFAMTIHKSQGSEFDNVLIVLPEGTSSQLLTRELLYTGITRAKEQVTILSSEESILHASNATVERVSGITLKLA